MERKGVVRLQERGIGFGNPPTPIILPPCAQCHLQSYSVFTHPSCLSCWFTCLVGGERAGDVHEKVPASWQCSSNYLVITLWWSTRFIILNQLKNSTVQYCTGTVPYNSNIHIITTESGSRRKETAYKVEKQTQFSCKSGDILTSAIVFCLSKGKILIYLVVWFLFSS